MGQDRFFWDHDLCSFSLILSYEWDTFVDSIQCILAWNWSKDFMWNCAGPLGSRAAKAIGFIDDMINYSCANAPLQQELKSDNVGNTAAFLASPLASAITGTVIYVDNGLHAMGLAVDSPCVAKAASAPSEMSNVPAWSGPLSSSDMCSLLLTVKSDHFFWPCLNLRVEWKGSPSFFLVP
jgi:hypothetical protein